METMNKLKALAVLLIISCCCYAQTPETFSGAFSEGLHELCKPDQVVVSPTPQNNLNVSGSANVVVRSATGITLKPGFSAGGWTSGGSITAKIDEECIGCAGVVDLGRGDTCLSSLTITDRERWYSFIADSVNMSVSVENDELEGDISIIEAYSTCTSETALVTDSLTGSETKLHLKLKNLTINSVYYFRLINDLGDDYTNVNICVTALGGNFDNAYFKEACGLNYVQASARLNQRTNDLVPTDPGDALPCTLIVAGIPSDAIIDKAFLWVSTVGSHAVSHEDGVFPFSLTNINGTTTDFNQPGGVPDDNYVASDDSPGATCWTDGSTHFGATQTTTYRTDVTTYIQPDINGGYNGDYFFDSEWPMSHADINGVTLMIIYTSCSHDNLSSLMIYDGLEVNNYDVDFSYDFAGYVPYINNYQKGFMIVSDIEDNTPATTWSFNSSGYQAINADMYNFIDMVVPTPNINGLNYVPYNITANGSDCYAVSVMGLYYTDLNHTCNPVTIDPTSSNIICGSGSSQLNGNINGGSGDLTILWSPSTGLSCNNCESPIASPTETTIYTLTVTDNETGCILIAEVTVIVSEPIELEETIVTNPTCSPGNDGAIYLEWSFINLPNQVSWTSDNGSSGTIPVNFPCVNGNPCTLLQGLDAGTYYITITDANGCPTTTIVTLTAPPPPSAPQISGNDCISGSLYTITNAVANVTYTWTAVNGITVFNPNTGTSSNLTLDANSGSFLVTATDNNNGCFSTTTYTYEPCCLVETSPGSGVNLPNVSPHETLPFSINTGLTTTLNVTGSTNNWLIANQSFTVNGTWTINESLTLNGCELLMGPNAAIAVRPGATLTITNGNANSHLYAGCGEMWQGIYVSPGGELLVKQNSLIEDAIVAAMVFGGGHYSMKDAIFNKNYIHTLFYPWSIWGLNFLPSGSITESLFLCQTTGSVPANTTGGNPAPTFTTLLPPYANFITLAGVVSLGGYTGLTVGGNQAGNLFENANMGIYTYKGSLESFDNIFTHIQPDDNCQNTGGLLGACGSCIYSASGSGLTVGSYVTSGNTANQFYDSYTGVYSTDDEDVSIENNIFYDVFTGIYAEKANNTAVITGNDMKSAVIGIYCYNNPGAEFTIGDELHGNPIDITPLGLFNWIVGIGIYMQEPVWTPADGLHFNIENNTVSNAITGIGLQNIFSNNGFTDGIAHNSALVYNSTNYNPTGIVEENVIGTMVYDNHVLSGSPDPNKSGIRMRNTAYNWLHCNTATSLGRGLDLAGVYTPSIITRNMMEGNDHGLHLSVNPINNLGAANAPWDNAWNQITTNTFDTWSDLNITPGSTIFYNNTTDVQHKPLNNGALGGAPYEFVVPSGSSSGSFFLGCNGIYGEHQALPTGEKKSLVIDALNDTSTTLQYNEEIKWMQKAYLYQILRNDDSLRTADSLLATFYDSCSVSNMGKLFRANNALTDSATRFSATIMNNYLDTLDKISANILPENAYRNVLTVAFENYLNTDTVEDNFQGSIISLLQDFFPDSTFAVPMIKDDNFTSSQKIILENIAWQCPYEYGFAVYMARAMLAKSDTIPFRYINYCESGSSSNKWDGQNDGNNTNTEPERNIKVYPNPASNSIYVEVNLVSEEKATLEFWNATGIRVKSINIASVKTEINLSELSSGLYYYVVYINEQKQQTGKQVIIK